MSLLGPSCRTPLSITTCSSVVRSIQRCHARVHDLRFLATHRAPADQRILETYREKLEQRARDEGLSSPEALKEAYAAKIAGLRKKARLVESTAASSMQSSTLSTLPSPISYPPPAPTPSQSAKLPPGIKPLSSYLDLTKLHSLTASQVTELWRVRHMKNPLALTAVIPAVTYTHMADVARRHPQFILPLPRAILESASAATTPNTDLSSSSPIDHDPISTEIHFLQFTFPHPSTSTLLFTHLAEYKLRQSHSTPHTTVTLYTDLLPTHGIVLLKGDVTRGRGIDVDGARWLLMCLQKFYGPAALERDGRRRGLVERFATGDASFRLEDLVEEAERIP